VAGEGLVPSRAAAIVHAELDALDDAISPVRPDAEVAAACREAAVVSPVVARAVALSVHLARETDGLFDPTVGPWIDAWGLRGDDPHVPSADARAEAAARVGWRRVRLDGDRLDCGGTSLDLSAVGQGLGADLVSDALVRAGWPDHVVAIEGEVRARGRAARAIELLGADADRLGPLGTVDVLDQGLATSGNGPTRRVVDGVEVGHLLDPRTGMPHFSGVASATVVAPTAALADGWATAAALVGPDALNDMEADGAAARLAMEDGRTLQSPGFPPVRDVQAR
jgi:thiamine biosynthesis lipoprotein